ncbi:NAD(P)-binding protein [Armillaria gallica]|uniref:NAD(P)-binding protein n=1 Tax=Armillaria gallica TaxID=47427 RepID=A0A2H3E9C1_ARMGA|nr:NAD(P)-binding protein [Armillaria gallica]
MGAAPSTTFNPVEDLPSLSGKVAVVTGSSSGIGFACLQHLSRMGAKVYMAVPDEDMTREALERVEKEGREPGLGEIIWHELDLKDPRNAKKSAERFISRESRLDILSLCIRASHQSIRSQFDLIVNNAAQLVHNHGCSS